ncbi:hypothetical protein GCM10011352_36710 [Marinobacterium zhoushanense]|uniref:Cell division protein ZipA n=1 Tax=Marinobacterium zhoushanense TaxID=1679163 RepID=A0ABQ1KQ77_9GAMM|nr:cell division protein ZipA [Marinobacterium zhoushanense]GGC07074.1 hypothetical protein GCM10011352_36710 [Marinobacterium zhoushanense]
MEISLREWLIIGGILVIALILFDGWRRIRGSRNRIRMDIDRSAIGDGPVEEVAQSNPELPNGGARRRTHAADHERHEPTFAGDGPALDDESDRLPEFEPNSVEKVSSKRSRHRNDEASESVPSAMSAPPERNPLHEMDPLFDDVPVEPLPLRAQREEVQRRDDEIADAEALSDAGSVSPTETEREQQRRHDDTRADKEDDEPFEMSFEFDPEQPIPVLMDRVRAQATASPQQTGADPAEQPSTTKREAPKQRRNGEMHPQLPFEDAEQTGEAEPASEQQGSLTASQPEPSQSKQAQIESSRVQAEAVPKRPAPEITPDPEDMLVIFVVAKRGEVLPGAVIHKIVDACGLEFGEMGIFHRYERPNAQGALQFNMANALQPGTFDLDTLESCELPAVTFFMSMHDPADPLEAYECMLATAETLARHLDAELLDGDRSVMRPQTKEHYRERIRDFEIHKRVKRAH